jgi:type IV secretion system protein VirB9
MKTALKALFLVFGLHVSASALQSDDRVETVIYRNGEVVPLRSASGSGVMIILAPGERVLGFDILDPEAISVDSWSNPGSLFVKTLRIPNNPRLAVRTHLRNYAFSVGTGPSEAATAVVKFNYGAEPDFEDVGTAFEVSRLQYRVTGEKALRPERISDNGEKTFLVWRPDQALPAVFAVNDFGREEIVDGYMRDGVFTIDRVYSKLVFRIDRKAARANRLAQ